MLLCITAAPPLLLADVLFFLSVLPRGSSVLHVLQRFALVPCCSVPCCSVLTPILLSLAARLVLKFLPDLGRHRFSPLLGSSSIGSAVPS